MSYADWITRKDQQSPVWVVEIAGTSSAWFSSIPLTAKSEAKPIIKPLKLPAQTMGLMGGDAQIATLSIEFLDIMSQGSPSATQFLYSRSYVGAPIKIYFGYAVDTVWSSANFPMVWAGFVADYQYTGKGWSVTCESTLSRAKATQLNVPEFTAEVASAIVSTDATITLKNAMGELAVTTGTDLLSGTGDFEDAADVTPWVSDNSGAGADPALSQSNTYAHGGTYSMKVSIDAGVNDECTVTYYNSGDYLALTGHKPGDTYAVTSYWKVDMNEVADPTVSAHVNVRLNVYAVDALGNTLEYAAYPGGQRYSTNTASSWYAQSCSITVFHPDSVALKVVWEFKTWVQDNPCLIFVDDLTVRKIPAFIAIGNEIMGVEAWNKETLSMTVSRGAIGTIQGAFDIDQTVRRVHPICGYGGDVILRILTTTTAGTNGDYDAGDGIGCGIDSDLIDTTALEALRTTYADHIYCLILDKGQGDALKFLVDEVCLPWGASLGISNRGLVTMWVVPSSVSSGTAISDNDMKGHPSVKCSAGDIINVVYAQTDYDHLDALKASRDSDPALERVEPNTKGKYDRDPKFIEFFELDEEDHRTDFVWKDQDLTSQSLFGLKPFNLKAKGVRTPTSAQLSLPVLRLYDSGSDDFHLQNGEAMIRSFSQRALTYYNSPVYIVSVKVGMEFADMVPGNAVALTSAYLPNLSPTTGGGIGISGVDGFVKTKSIGNGEVSLEVVMTGWASTIPTDQPAYDAITDPGAGNIGLTWATSADFTTGQYGALPKYTGNVIRMLHNYGANCTTPTSNKWARTEIRRYIGNGLGYCVAGRSDQVGMVVAGVASSTRYTRNAKVLWMLKDGTYSAAYTKTEIV